MKVLKILCSVFSLFTIISLFCLPVLGETITNNDEWIRKPLTISEEGSYYSPDYILINTITGEEIGDVYETHNGIPVRLTAEEALDRLNNIPKVEDSINEDKSFYSFFDDVFEKTSGPKKVIGNEEKLSQDVNGGKLGASIGVAQSYEKTIKEDFSIDVGIKKEIIRANSGIEWSRSLTKNVTATHNVEPYRTAYVAFKPYYNEIQGDLIIYEIPDGGVVSVQKITARTPIKLSTGVCDGLEYLRYIN